MGLPGTSLGTKKAWGFRVVAADNSRQEGNLPIPPAQGRQGRAAFETARHIHLNEKVASSGLPGSEPLLVPPVTGPPAPVERIREPEPPAPPPELPAATQSAPVMVSPLPFLPQAAIGARTTRYGFPTTSMPRDFRAFFPPDLRSSEGGDPTDDCLDQRRRLSSLNSEDRTVAYLWALQMQFQGRQDGAVYLRALENPDDYYPEELDLVRRLAEEEIERYGAVTGKALDREFFRVYGAVTGRDHYPRYHSARLRVASGPLDLEQPQQDCLSPLESAVVRLWGNMPLFNGGRRHSAVPCDGLTRREATRLLFAPLASEEDPDSLEAVLLPALDKLYGLAPIPPEPRWSGRCASLVRAGRARPFLSGFPAGGDATRYRLMAGQIQPELAGFDAQILEIARLAGVVPEASYLAGRLEIGLILRPPRDKREFASYHRARTAGRPGGTLFQRDTLPGTRLALVEDPQLFHTAIARMYAYQFAAYAVGGYPLSPQGMEHGAAAFTTMGPDARMFVQIAALYASPLFGGPGVFRNNLLRVLLERRDLPQLSELPGVGVTDLETLGAVSTALNQGLISLNDLLASGAVHDLTRLRQVVHHIMDGTFNNDLGRYDVLPIGEVEENPRMAELLTVPEVADHYALFDLDGDTRVRGLDAVVALSHLCSLVNLMLSGARPDSNAPAALRLHHYLNDVDRDGVYSLADIRQVLQTLQPVLEALKLDLSLA
ncbi:MAG: hypothetical protein AB1758_00315 [Candidatus Eremiobacterota bacterium]